MTTHPQVLVDRMRASGTLPSPAALAPPGGDYFVFASPSEREGSKHADMSALEPLSAYARVHPAVEDVEPGVGYWADGKEESGLVWVKDAASVPAVAHDLRERFNQKATIGFAQGTGPDSAHILRTRETDPDKIHAQLSDHGIEYKTVIPGPRGSTVFVLDSGNVLASPVSAYAKQTGAHLDSIRGTVHFVGGDERPRAVGTSVKLSRKFPKGPIWQKPNGELWADEKARSHMDTASRGNTTIHDMMEAGWNRVIPIGSTLVVHNESRRPSQRQKDALIDHALEEGHDTINYDSGNDDRDIWTKLRLSLKESINKARREGDTFVKDVGSAGSPHAEEAAASVFRTIGLPHLPVREHEGRVVGPWVAHLTSASDDPSAFRRHLGDTDRIGHLTLGEWLVGAGDRIARNYQTHPSLGLIGNDYGHAFHPLTDLWPDHKGGQNPPVESYKSLARSPNKWAEYHPHVSALPGLLRHLGLPREDHHAIRVPDQAVKSALLNADTLVRAAHNGTRDLPEHERALAGEAMKLRLANLARHFTNHGRVTIGDLVKLTEDVRREASSRAGPGPV